MNEEPDHIASLLNGSLRKLGVFTPVTNERVAEALRILLGEDLYAYCSNTVLYRGVLTLQVANASFAMQVRYDTGKIITALNDRLGEGTVRSIRIRQ